jgi:hypothetical protein
VLLRLAEDAATAGLAPDGLVASPRAGRDGNREFLALLTPAVPDEPGTSGATPSWDIQVDQALG